MKWLPLFLFVACGTMPEEPAEDAGCSMLDPDGCFPRLEMTAEVCPDCPEEPT